MGLRRTLNIDLTLTDESRDLFGVETRVIMRKNSGESWAHVLMKFLSYAMFYHPDLHIERSVGQHYKPDLVRTDDRGIVRQWIDCGVTTIYKLDRITRANPHAIIQIVKPTAGAAATFKLQAEETIRQPDRVHYTGFESGFLNELSEVVWDRHHVSIVLSGGHLYASVDEASIDTRITRLLGRAPDSKPHGQEHA